MEVSTTGNVEGVEWSEDARNFLVRLVPSDAVHRANKVEISRDFIG